MPLLEAGKYISQLSGPTDVSHSGIIIYETSLGALCAAVPCKVAEGPEAGKELKATLTLVKQDGTIQTRTLETLKGVFGWASDDPFWLMDTDLSACRFEIVVEVEQGQKDGVLQVNEQGEPVYYSRIAWINPLGGMMKMPEPADRRTILAKHGARFRAILGGAPVKPPTAAPAGRTTSAPPTKPPAKRQAEMLPETTATMEEAWQAVCDAYPAKSDQELNTLWFDLLKQKFNTDDTSKVTPAGWGQIVTEFDNIKM